MDLFTITCTTCKSRLKVREQGAVGHILACPKCGGMVLVKPPEGWQPGKPSVFREPEAPAGVTAEIASRSALDGGLRTTDETLSESNFDAVDDLLADAPPRTKPSATPVATDAPALARKRFAGAPPHASGPLAAAIAPQVPSDVATEDIAPTPSREVSRPSPYWLLVGVSIVTGIGLALAVVAASIGLLSGDGDVADAAGSSATPGQAVSQEATIPATAPGAPNAVKSVSATPALPVVETTQPMPPDEVPPEPVELPVGGGPPDLNPVESTPAVAAGPNSKSPFDRLLEPERDPLAQSETPGAALAKPPPTADAAPTRLALPRPEPREINIADRLADPLPGIETEGTPLSDFLQIMSDLSTIPIVLEPDALPLAQASAVSPVVLKLSNTTIDDALTAGLGRLGLEHLAAEGAVVVRLIEPNPLKTQNYPIGDLVADAEQAAEFAEDLKSLVEPASWRNDESAGAITAATKDQLTIRQRKAVHAQLFLLCEKLRTARKLKHASRFDKALFQIETRSQLAKSRLEMPVTLNFGQPTPFLRILSRLEEASGVRILVDWRDAAAAGWNPAGEATLVVEKQSLATALTKLLEPMDLAWRVVDGQTLQVVAPQTLATRAELEFYPSDDLVQEDPTGETLLAKVRAALGDDLFNERGGLCDLRYDPAGKCLLASLPQPRQVQLAALLIQWRGEK